MSLPNIFNTNSVVAFEPEKPRKLTGVVRHRGNGAAPINKTVSTLAARAALLGYEFREGTVRDGGMPVLVLTRGQFARVLPSLAAVERFLDSVESEISHGG
jgi:hypothetical protein